MTMNRLALAAVILAAVWVPCRGADEVKVYEGTKRILTGPARPNAPPQERPGDFKPVEHPAVYVENEYLRCCLLPQVGGRVYEVYNKASKSHLFYVNPYLEVNPSNFGGGAWNLGGVEVNFPYFHHGNTYNDRWQWAEVRRDDRSAGVAMGFTSRPTMQRAVLRVMLRPGVARVDFEYRFENLNPYPWGLAAWINTMHPKTMDMQFILPSPWMAGHGHNCFRTHLQPWPIRDGVDFSWQKNLPKDISEFAFMPRLRFHGCYEHKTDRGAVRVFDPNTLPAAKLWSQKPPIRPEQYYQHFEIWTATSPVMEDAGRQAELSCYTAADSWHQAWDIGGYVFANDNVAINLVRRDGGTLLAGVCGTRRIPKCVVSLREGHDTFLRQTLDVDPAAPYKMELAAPPGDVTMEVVGPDGTSIARYELRADEVPREQWAMPEKPRWQGGINTAYHDEDYSTLWRGREHFFDGAIGRYNGLLKKDPESTKLMVDLARSYLKDEQVRLGSWYRNPGPKADEHAARRRETDLASAAELLRKAIERDPQHARAHFYLGLALERQGTKPEAAEEYRAALTCQVPAPAAGMYLARLLLRENSAEALDWARRAAEAYPQSTRARQVLIAVLTATGGHEEAISAGKRLHALDPSDPITTLFLSRTLAMAGDDAEAKAYAEKTERLLAGDDDARKGFDADVGWLAGANE